MEQSPSWEAKMCHRVFRCLIKFADNFTLNLNLDYYQYKASGFHFCACGGASCIVFGCYWIFAVLFTHHLFYSCSLLNCFSKTIKFILFYFHVYSTFRLRYRFCLHRFSRKTWTFRTVAMFLLTYKQYFTQSGWLFCDHSPYQISHSTLQWFITYRIKTRG